MEDQEEKPKLLEQVRNIIRLHHFSLHTERTYSDWIKRYQSYPRWSAASKTATLARSRLKDAKF
jgi:hypothetical protein